MVKLVEAQAIPTPIDAERAVVKLESEFSLPEMSKIGSAEEYEDAGAALRRIKGQLDLYEDERKKLTRPIDDAKKAVMRLFEGPIARLKEREAAIKHAIITYNQAVEEQRRRLEAQMRDEQAKEQQKREAQAARLAARGKAEQAEALLETPVPAAIVVMDKGKPEGIALRKTWKARVADVQALFDAGYLEYFSLNQSALDAFARATHGSRKLPGVEFYEDTGVAARRD